MSTPSVDVIVPVYNAPAQTRRCVESVLLNMGSRVGCVWLEDDASGTETRGVLKVLASHPAVAVNHAPRNRGFGGTVNRAIARSSADYVLVLNSDTEVRSDFLGPLLESMRGDPQLAGLNVAGNVFDGYDFTRYRRNAGGYVRSHFLLGYAFLIRRKAYDRIGGFDPIFGRGYFEDTDLSRRLCAAGFRIGVHPETWIYHEGGASFGSRTEQKSWVARNRGIYYQRYPDAGRNVLLLSGCESLEKLSEHVMREAERVCERGGSVHWMTPVPRPELLCLEMRSYPPQLWRTFRLIRRGRRERSLHHRITDAWICPGAPRGPEWLLRSTLALRIRRW